MNKQEYLKKAGIIEFDKEEITQELVEKGFKNEEALEWITEYKYYRIMSDGNKMFYSERYIQNHTVQELEEKFKDIDLT